MPSGKTPNPNQQAAITHQSGPLMILAGAGTGKTFTLLHRIRHLISTNQINPEHVLLLTFTEKATAEAKARKGAFISKIVSKELILNALTEETKDAREKELSAWEETKLDGFASALENIPETEDSERTFGKGKAHDVEEQPIEAEKEVTRLFAMKDGKIALNKEALRGN